MLGFEGFGGLKDYGGLGVWGFKDIGPGRMPQPARSSGRHQPGRAQDTDYEDLSPEALGFFEVWPAWMPQPSRSSCAWNHHPERAGCLKGYEVLRVMGF